MVSKRWSSMALREGRRDTWLFSGEEETNLLIKNTCLPTVKKVNLEFKVSLFFFKRN
jgi:hypothetical protein